MPRPKIDSTDISQGFPGLNAQLGDFGTAAVSPTTNGNFLIPHGLGKTPDFARITHYGDYAGVDRMFEVESVNATNIVGRCSTRAGVDITTGGPFNVYWEARCYK